MTDTLESSRTEQSGEIEENIQKARQAMEEEQWPRAIVILREVLKMDPAHIEANYMMGACLIEFGDPDNGLEYFTKIGEYRLETVAEYIKVAAPMLNVTVDRILEAMPQKEALAKYFPKTDDVASLPGVERGALKTAPETTKVSVRKEEKKECEEDERPIDTDRLYPNSRNIWLATILAIISLFPPVPYEWLRGYLSFLPELQAQRFSDLVPAIGQFTTMPVFITGWGLGQLVALRFGKAIYMFILAFIFSWLTVHGADIQAEVLNYPYPDSLAEWLSVSTWGTLQQLAWYLMYLGYLIGLFIFSIVSSSDAFIIWYKNFLVCYIVEIKNRDDIRINAGANFFLRVGDIFKLYSYSTGKRKGRLTVVTVNEKTAMVEFRPDGVRPGEEPPVPKVGDVVRGI